eukprot:g627.t1
MAPYTYEWNTGATTAMISGLTPGIYEVTVTDAKGCVDTDEVTIENIGGPTVDAGDDDEICAGESTSLTATTTDGTAPISITWMPATASGGTPPYTYAWSNGASGATVMNLAPGTYGVTVTDANGCMDNGSVTINSVLCASLGDFVWEDLDADGVQDANEPPVEGVTVNLKDASGAVINTTTTNGAGFYEFTDLEPGDYSVQFVLPAGYEFTALNQGGDEGLDSDADPAMNGMTEVVNLESGENYPDLDAGLTTYDLALTKDINGGTPGPYGQNSPVDFNITVTNEGSQAAANVVVTDRPQVGLTIVGFDANGTAVIDNGDETYTIPSLAVGESVTFIVKTTINSDFQGTSLVNEAEITTDDGDDTDSTPNNDDPTEDDQDDEEVPLRDISVTDTNLPDELMPYDQYFDAASDLNGNGFVDFIDNNNDGQSDEEFVWNYTLTYTETTTNHAEDMAEDLCASLGDFVWEDLDADGIQDAGEPGIENVTVMLLDGDGNMLDQTTTDGTGFYEFTGLVPGDYIVKFTAPAGFEATPADEGGDDTVDSDADETTGQTGVITLETGDNDPTNDAGFYEPASLGDFVWLDANADGIQDAGEDGIEGVTVMLLDGDGNMLDQTTTDGTGFYEFTGLVPGDYIVKFTAPADLNPSPANEGGDDTVDSDADETTGESPVVNLESGENDPTIDAGFYGNAALGDFVWEDLNADGIQDAGEPGIENVTVMLLDGDGNMLDQTTTDANGFYEFTGLTPGDYIVKFTAPAGFEASPANEGGDDTVDSDADETTGQTGVITLTTGEIDDTNDAGFYQPASLGDFVWEDLNADGIQDAGEPGIENVTVMLLDGDGNMLDQTTTDGTGFYEFTGLTPGDYIVKFTAPAGFEATPANQGGDDALDSDADETTGQTGVITLESGENDPTNDAGYYQPASLGDFVWEDTDADGIQDAGEPGIENVTVMLLDGDGNMLDQTTTDANGFYEFTGLVPGDYIVKFTAPAGYEATPANEGGDDTVDSDADETTGQTGVVTLESGENDDTNDAGFYEPASLGDFVWLDANADGIQDAGEDGIEGVTVMLLDADGNMLDQTTTDGTGFYEFTGLVPGDYIVKFTAPADLNPSPANEGGDDTVDSDADETTGESPVVNLESGENDPTIDAGFYGNAALGDFVWEDLNADGIQDAGEPGIENVTVMLLDGDGNMLDQTTTDANGFYEFTGLTPGDYIVKFTAPAGFEASPANEGGDDTVDSDADETTGQTGVITLTTGEIDDTNDAGFYQPASLGDFVWEDLNADGIQDAGEPGIENVTVMLLDGDGNMLDQTTTDGTGFYEFTGLTPGDYIVKFTAPAGFEATPANQGGDDALDSDADETTGQTGVITLESGENDPTNDAGYYQPASLGDFVWEDTDADGIQDAGEPGIENVTVMLLDGDGNMLDQTTTDANGFYEFTGLVPGDYIVKFTAPAGFEATPANEGGDDTVDSDADETTGQTGVVTLESGENDDTNDAGFYEPASLGDFVWEDLNGDGIQDANEPGVEGVTVNLKDETGAVIATTTTDGTGFYEFTGLVPGDYSVQFVLPTGFLYTDLNEGGDDTVDSDADPAMDGMTATVTLESGEENTTLDGGILREPALELVKNLVDVQSLGDEQFVVTYEVVVTNTGGATQYDLTDTPGFDDDIVITGASYTTDAAGNAGGALAGSGPWTLADDQFITTFGEDTYTITVNVTRDLAVGSTDGGDNEYTPCAVPGDGPGSAPGQGLYNLAELDTDNDGQTDLEDDACGDLPNIDMEKDFVSATPNGDGTYTVQYTVTVVNDGGAEGTYGLTDTPAFDDDVTINSGSFSGQNSGALTAGSNVLAANETIAAGATHTYNLSFNVSLGLSANSTDGGDNVYTACSEPGNGPGSNPGEGLYNLAELDVDSDGDTDIEDDACGDLPLYDLSLTKSVTSSGPYEQESTVTYAVVVTNEGEIDATNIEVTDTPETGLNYVGSDADGVNVTDLGSGLFGIASLPIGQSVTINLTYTIDPGFQGSSLLNKAEITEDDPYDDVDSDPETSDDVDEDGDGDGDDDDEDEAEIPVEQNYDLSLTKDLLSAGPFSQGSNVTFTINVTNEGSLDAANVEVTDRPDADFNFVGADVPANVVDNGDGTFVILSLPQGATESWEVTYQIDPNFQGTSLTNEAEITEDDGDDEDSTPDNDDPTEDDQDDEEVPVDQVFDLALRKTTVSSGPFVQGSTVTYQIEVINQGSLDATDVEVTDYIPMGMTLTDGAWAQSGSLATRTIAGPIAANGGTATITITMEIDATFQGTSLVNYAEISDATNELGEIDEDSPYDQDSTNDAGGQPNSPADDAVGGDGTGTPGDGVASTDEDAHDGSQIDIEQEYDLALTKDLLSAGPFEQGSEVTFTITVTNEGSLNAANVEVTDRPDADFSFVGANVPANVVDNGDGTFVILSLPQGATESWEVTYQIAPDFQGFSLVNEAEITEDDGDDEDSTPNNDDPTEDDQDDEEVPVEQTASIDIEKATNGQDADTAPGVFIIVPNTAPTVTWTYVVTNTGTLDLTNVVVVDDQEGQVGVIPFLAAGASETLTLTGTAMRGRYTNNSVVTGQPVDENGDPTGDPVTDEDPSNYTGVFINIDKEGDREEICAGEEVNFSLTMRILGGTEGIQLRNMSVEDSNLPDDLVAYDQYFDPNSDPDGNGYVDFIDNNNDGASDQEFVWNYALTYTETTTNFAEDMAEIWYVDPTTGDEFFIGTAMNMDQWTVTVNQDLCASLGDFVWEDYDADGIQDDGEPGVEGVTVNLKDENGNIIDTQTTGANGEYLFTELTPGTYSVQFELPDGFTFTSLNEGGDDTTDSDADPVMDGMTETVTLNNGDNNLDQDAGIVRDPDLDMVKDLVEVTSLGDENFQVTYTVTVTNNGGATSYDLTDTPLFDDDITITGASYTSDAAGNAGGALAGSGPWTLADDQFITTFGTHVYTITVDVNRDLSEGSTDGGDNEYTPCAVPGNGPGSGPGQGLYNLAELDADNDGETDISDDACGDLPNLQIEKDFVSATPNGDGTYTVTYNVFVSNDGGAAGSYTLTDTPSFDDDITINSGSFSGQNSGALTSGTNTLATNEAIDAGATHEYNLSFNVTLDLSEGSTDGGDNEYNACSELGNGPGSSPGEGLYNLAELDVDNDGDTDLSDDACGDLPNITMVKDFGAATANGDGTYTVTYTVTVANNGGADGTYSLTDTPSFDDDITINSGSFSGQNSGALTDATNTLATDESIAAGATHVYNLSFNVTLDLSGDADDNDGGDNEYTACDEPGNGPGSNPGEGLYNLAELDADGDGDTDIADDACGDLPNLILDKELGAVTANGDGTYTVTYTVSVTNNGGADGSYTLTDTPSFDDDVTINSGSFSGQNSGALIDGTNTLATNESIAAGATHTYNLSFNVSLDLTTGSNDGGDNEYTACGSSSDDGSPAPNEGLYNLAELDVDNDGDTDITDDACGDLPNITLVKDFGAATLNPDGTYTVTYTVTVGNDGGAEGIYSLTDTPSFDDDITINSGSFSGQNSGALTDGTNTLATNESIAAGATHVYNLSFNVTLDLSGDADDTDGGDNEYTACDEPGNGPGSNPGEGLYNLAELDADGDGDVDLEDDACGDLPNITLDKTLLGVTDNGDGTFTASYQITVSNNGGAEGTYSLDDVAEFDDDVIIISGGFLIERGGAPLSGNFVGDPSPLNLATNEAIAPGATHTYTIDYLADLDLSEGSTDGGDNVYTACADPSGGDGSEPGQGLYNRAELDLDGDGNPDLEDDVCGDVPTADLSLIKVVDNETPDIGDVVTFTITVTNDGPQDATGVGVEDVVPNGYSNIANISNDGVASANVINWDDISLAVGESIDLTFTATVNAPGTGISYVNIAEIDEADQYDEDSTPGNGADTNPGNGIGSEDPDGTQDPSDEDDGDDAGVMPPCLLSVEFDPTSCQDNGTPTNPNDDFFEIIATVSGLNASGSWTAVDSRGNTYTGSYGEPFTFGPYGIFGNEDETIVITITDSADGACITSITTVTPDDTCSDDCIITVTEPQTVECIGSETNTPDDDAFIFTINVNGVNVGDEGWRAVDQFGNEYFGNYGTSPNNFVDVGPYSWTDFAGESIIFTVTDVANPDCGQGTLVLEVPSEPCSQDCSINLDVEHVICDDNGTPWDPSDDVYWAWVNISGTNASFQGWITDDEGRPEGDNTGFYGLYEFGPYPIAGGNHDLTIRDRVYDDCEATITIQAPPGTCSDGCRLDVFQQTPVCDDNGTATPDDDVYYVTITVQPLGQFGNGWRVVLGNGQFEPGGAYGEPVTLGPYPISEGPRTIKIADNTDISCQTTFNVIPPEPCSMPDPCTLATGEFEQGPCNNNGTPADGSDDFYVLTYGAPTVTDPAGTQYELLLDGVVVATTDYGVGGSIIVPADGQTHTLTWRDAAEPECADSAELPAVENCEDPCEIDYNATFVYNDNGTPLDHTDDFYELIITVTNSGGNSGFWTISNMMGLNETHPYGATVTISPIDANMDFSATIFDSENEVCSELLRKPGQAVVGDFAWIDEDCDGVQDPNEAGLAGITVTITGTDMMGNPVIATTVTDENGAYLFTNLPSGFGYKVTFSLPDGYEFAPANQGGNDELDSDVVDNGMTNTFMLMSSSADLTIDAGFCALVCNIEPGTFTQGDCDYLEGQSMYVLTFTEPIIENGCGEYEVLYNGTVVYTGTTGDGGSAVMVAANGEAGTLTFRDACDNDCSRDVTVPGVESCDPCTIEPGTFTQGDCEYVNGASTYVLTFIAPAIENGCGEYEVLYNGTLVYTGTTGDAGSTITVAANGEAGTLTFQDACDSDCVTTVTVPGVEPCDPCTIAPLNFTQGECEYDPATGVSTYTLTFEEPVISNGCGEYEVYFNGTLVHQGTIGDGGSSIEVAANGEAGVLLMTDACDSDCSRSIDVPGVDPCDPALCTIEAGTVTVIEDCNDNGTSADATDDFYVVSFTAPNVEDGCGAYIVELDGELVYTGVINDDGGTLNIPADGNSHFIMFRDACDADCAAGLELAPVDPCSDPCTISAELTAGPACLDDNSFEVSFVLSGENAGLGWFATDTEGNVFNGFYNTESSRTYTDVAPGTEITITFIDVENGEECFTELTFVAPDCDEPCAQSCVAYPSVCDNNGTPDDPSDDTYTATILVVGQNTGSCFTYVIGGETFTGTYGVPFEVGPFPISGGNVTFPVEDCEDSSCGHLMLVLAPEETCSNGPEITVECPISNHFCPILEEDIMLYRTDPFECTSTVEVAAPEVSGACNDGDFTFTVELVNQFGTVLATIEAGEPLVFNNVAIGDYFLRYTVTDDCGTVGTRDCRIRVADLDEPVAICVGSLNVQLGGWGLARLYTNSVDMGSYDNCAIASIELRRHIDRDQDTCEDLDETQYSDWGPYVQFTCCDASTYVTVEMRVTDIHGNYNICCGKATIEIFDALGSKVFHLDGEYTEGRNEVRVDVSRYSDGLYFYQLRFEEETLNSKMIITKQ